MHLMKIGYRIYNFDLLVDAEFTPPTSGVDEETGKEFSRRAKLALRFAAPQSDARTNYDGDYIGEEAGSYICALHDEEATAGWGLLCQASGV